MTTRQFSYAVKSKLPGGLCLIIIGTEGGLPRPQKTGRKFQCTWNYDPARPTTSRPAL
jgi:hypothetical protein